MNFAWCGKHWNKRSPRTFVNLANELIIVSRKCVVMLVIMASMSTMDSSVNKVRIIINVSKTPSKVLLLVSNFNPTRIFATGFSHPVSHFTKFLPAGVDCSKRKEGRKEGRTETELRVACSNFAKTPRMELYSSE